MIYSKLAFLFVSLALATPCFAGNTGGGGVLGITVVKANNYLGVLKQQQQRLDLPVEYLGQIGSSDVLKTSEKNFVALQRSVKAFGVTVKTEDKVIRSFVSSTSTDNDSITLKTLDGQDIMIVKSDVEVDVSNDDQDLPQEVNSP